MYIKCTNCGWSQDNFYTAEYHPANKLQMSSFILYELMTADSAFLDSDPKLSLKMKDVIADEFEAEANSIRNMRWLTKAEWEKEKEKGEVICLKCGKAALKEF